MCLAFSTLHVLPTAKIIMLVYLNTWCQTHYFAAQRCNLITNFCINEEGK
jgi:hypothetical protein